MLAAVLIFLGLYSCLLPSSSVATAVDSIAATTGSSVTTAVASIAATTGSSVSPAVAYNPDLRRLLRNHRKRGQRMLV